MGPISQGLVVLALMAALVFGARFAVAERKGWRGAGSKTLLTALLALAVALVPGGEWFWTIPVGLALGALGDLCLALRGERVFLAGVAAFGLGHLAYTSGFLAQSAALGFDGVSRAEGVVMAGLLALVASTELWLGPRTGGLRGPVRVYVLLIGLMGFAALVLPEAPGQSALRGGAALFVVSDLMLALQLFVVSDPQAKRWMALALWPAYWAGQALIGLGAVLFWQAGVG